MVEKREHLSRDEFVERYVHGCRPVVITGLARDWPALQRWSPQDLKQRFGHLEVEVQAERQADPQYELNKLQHRRRVRLGDFVDQVLAVRAQQRPLPDGQQRAAAPAGVRAAAADIGSLPDYCDASQLANSCSFWFGPAGTVTPLHHDTLMLFHTQVVGRKRWRFISPLETPRALQLLRRLLAGGHRPPRPAPLPGLRPGEGARRGGRAGRDVFLPLGWWHQVTALDLSLSFSFSNPAVPNSFSYRNPDIRNW